MLLEKLKSIENERVLVGLRSLPDKNNNLGGVVPAVQSFELCGFSGGTNRDEQDARVVQNTINRAKKWIDAGGVAAFHWHWPHPLNPKGSAWLAAHGRKEASPPFDLVAATIAETAENDAAWRDIEWVAQFLAQLGDREYIFRPLHEMEGSWFWWGAAMTPEGYAGDKVFPDNTPEELRRFAEFVRLRFRAEGIDPIWQWSMAGAVAFEGHHANGIDTRKRCYPGDWDMLGVDIYPNPGNGWGDPRESSWPFAEVLCTMIDPDAPYVISECPQLPNPELMAQQVRRPLYCLHWHQGDKNKTEFADHELYMDFAEWTQGVKPKPEPTPEPEPMPEPDSDIVLNEPGYIGTFDGTNAETYFIPPLNPPFTVEFVFRRLQAGNDTQRVGICEAVMLTTDAGMLGGPVAHCDVGEEKWFSVRNRCMDKTVAMETSEKRRTPFAFIQNGSTPAKDDVQDNPVVWEVGKQHHAALVFDYWDGNGTLLAYQDDNPRTIQGAFPRDSIGAGFTTITVGRCNLDGHEMELSHLLITKGAKSQEQIAARARALLGGNPPEPTPEPEPTVERGSYELITENCTTTLVLTKLVLPKD